ncbi:hypothetical protein JYU04_04500, partial [Dehalococcoides mccartyi]|nr:hypothetical protein [Dehalococcoides mccartyi]
MEIPSAYFLDSTDSLKFESELFRTAGSHQVQEWVEIGQESGLDDPISNRRYFKGLVGDKVFFAKEFLRPNIDEWTVVESVRYQFENFLLLIDLPFVPTPLFYTTTMLGIEFVEGRSIKQLAIDGVAQTRLQGEFVSDLARCLEQIETRLSSRSRRYDASFNNVIVGEDN